MHLPSSSCAQIRFAEAHGPGGRLSAMAFDANQRRLLTGGSDGVLRFWNANNGSVLREVCSLSAAFAILQTTFSCTCVSPHHQYTLFEMPPFPRRRLSHCFVSHTRAISTS